jgi:O-antigen/teichoic acid export membrane protein
MTLARRRESLAALLQESLIYGAGMVLARGLGILLTPILARVFDAREFGILDLLQTAALLCSLLLSVQMESALLRYYPDDHDRGPLLTTYLVTQVALGVLFVAAVYGIGVPLAHTLGGFDAPGAIMAAAGSVVAGLLYTHALTLLRAERKAATASAVIAVNTVLNLSGVGALVVTLRWGLAGVFLARALTDGACAAGVVWGCRLRYTGGFSWPVLRRYLRFGLPLTPSGLMTFGTAHIGKVLLLPYASVADVGLLAVANRVATVLKLSLMAFRQAWLPYAFSIAQREDADSQYAQAFRGYARVGLACGLAFVLFAREAVLVMAGAQYLGARMLLGLLTAGSILGGLPYLFNIGLLLGDRTEYYTVAVGASSTVTVLGSWLFIARYGLIGAPIAGVLGSVVLAVLVLYFSQRVRPIPYDLKAVWLLIGATVALGGLGATDLLEVPLIVRAAVAVVAAWWLLRDVLSAEVVRSLLARRRA